MDGSKSETRSKDGKKELNVNTNKFKILIAGLIVVMMTGFAISQEGAGPRHYGEFGPLGFFTKALNLTDAQQTQIKQIVANEKPTLHPLMQQEGQVHQQMMQLVTGGNFDETKAQAIIAQESQTHAQIELEHARIMSQAYQILTPDQKTKFAQVQARHQQRMAQHSQEEQPTPNQ
jgi:protein CpxP